MESFSGAVKMADANLPKSWRLIGNVKLHAAITFCGAVKRKSQRLQC
ncbi:MAG: hypothetical protein H6Q99_1778 [Proteobacteria bacterium]|nr:hypothetical protein [Pseudomonadota bacterium]